ncbi:pentapeptide repeat-containing protein [Actinoplanes sp. NPDC048967]|uniref:pentapeptide repeat-containing protein n=1 Tax=Actinoplanes sp. NPDC048967 TaxID=3155269 RepID=UPI00340F830F
MAGDGVLLDLLGRASWLRLVVVLIGVACLAASFRLRPVYYYSPEMPPGARSMGTISAWWMLVGACAVIAAMWVTTAWLFEVTAAIPAGTGRATARVEAIRTGLTAAGGAGAATALLLAFHRQRHLEANAIGVEFDAAEKRVTELDLTGAVLYDWNFHRCVARHAKFIGARFSGESFFGEAQFLGFAVFGGAVFEGDAWFADTAFHGDAWFVDATFLSGALFTGAGFQAEAGFRGTAFHADVLLDAATFRRGVEMGGASTVVSHAEVRLPAGWAAGPTGSIERRDAAGG